MTTLLVSDYRDVHVPAETKPAVPTVDASLKVRRKCRELAMRKHLSTQDLDRLTDVAMDAYRETRNEFVAINAARVEADRIAARAPAPLPPAA